MKPFYLGWLLSLLLGLSGCTTQSPTLPESSTATTETLNENSLPVATPQSLESLTQTLTQQLASTRAQVILLAEKKQITIIWPSYDLFTYKNAINPHIFPELTDVAHTIATQHYQQLQILGFTDNQGRLQEKLDLSLKWAKTIANYLAQQGIDKNRLHIEARGEFSPVTNNLSAAGRLQNRRIEIIVQC